jgi:hypothetical protein
MTRLNPAAALLAQVPSDHWVPVLPLERHPNHQYCIASRYS